MSAFQHLAGYSFSSAGAGGLAPTQLLLPPTTPTTSASGPCCESGRPVMTDPITGQTVCSCQYTPSLLSAYPRLASLPESVYNSYAAQGLVPLGADPAAFYSALGAPFELKDGSEALRSLAQPGPYYTYDPSMGYPYGYGMDLNSASRRKNATRENTNTLKAWLYEHRKNPYPTKGEKIMLAIITKMTLTQVSTWFANARRRLKKENKMTWSPKNKGEDDDDDDDDKAENGHHHHNSSDGELRDRDTDSVGGMAVDSDDEIIDAGMECDAMPHHLLPGRVLGPRPSSIGDDDDATAALGDDAHSSRGSRPASPLSPPASSRLGGFVSSGVGSGGGRLVAPGSPPMRHHRDDCSSPEAEKDEELIVCDDNADSEADSSSHKEGNSPLGNKCNNNNNNNNNVNNNSGRSPEGLPLSRPSGSPPPPRTQAGFPLMSPMAHRFLSSGVAPHLRESTMRPGSPPHNPHQHPHHPQRDVRLAPIRVLPLPPSSTALSPPSSSRGENGDLNKGVSSSSTMSTTTTVSSESATTPKPRIWSMADMATSGVRRTPPPPPSHPPPPPPPPGLPMNLAAHKPPHPGATSGPYHAHFNGFRLPWVSVSGAFINHPMAAAAAAAAAAHGGMPHPYVLGPHAMLPRTLTSPGGIMATHGGAGGGPSHPGEGPTRPHPYSRPPGHLPPPPPPPPPPRTSGPVITAPPPPPPPPPPPCAPPPSVSSTASSSSSMAPQPPPASPEMRPNGNHQPPPRHSIERLKDGPDSKRFPGPPNGADPKLASPHREYEDTAFKPVAKRPIV